MYKNKKIKFKQVNDQEIEILLEYEDFKKGGGFEKKEKIIGTIQTPSGTGADYINAIQVCGISEAFDFWGCGNFGKPKQIPNDDKLGRQYYYNVRGKKIMEQVKDIQLYFDEDTQKCSLDDLNDCNSCYNTECTCDIKQQTDLFAEEFGNQSPFIIKRTQDIKELSKVKK